MIRTLVVSGLQGLKGLKGVTCTQDPKGVKGDKGDKGVFGSDGKTAVAADLKVANGKIIHLATSIDANDANDAVSNSKVDTQTNNVLKTDRNKTNVR